VKGSGPLDRIPYERASKELIDMNTTQRAEYLAHTYADAILRLSYTYLKNTQDAQDICQTVFVRLLTEQREFESPAHERAYILRMAANACKDILKSPWRKRTLPMESAYDAAAPEAPGSEVLDAVNSLPPHYRAVIYLYYYEGHQAAEIGQILGVPTATVHTRLARGRAKLKTMLGGMEYEQSV
jgi:RNA polymerase sigma factor (sigma-70 family)